MTKLINELKILLLQKDMSLTELLEKVNETNNRTEALSNFHRKLSKETVKYKEMVEILSVLGYKIKWVANDSNNIEHK